MTCSRFARSATPRTTGTLGRSGRAVSDGAADRRPGRPARELAGDRPLRSGDGVGYTARPLDWGQTLLTALLVALVAAVATLWAARRSAGAVERAAERGARGAVEAAALTSTATRDAAELARSALIEKDVREDRRPRVRALQKRAAEREAIYKQ